MRLAIAEITQKTREMRRMGPGSGLNWSRGPSLCGRLAHSPISADGKITCLLNRTHSRCVLKQNPCPPGTTSAFYGKEDDVSRQQQARDALRSTWHDLLRSVLPEALHQAQTDAAADAVVNDIWPALPAEALVRLDRADPRFLLRSPTVPAGLEAYLQKGLLTAAEQALAAALRDNPHARGGKLGDLIRQEWESRRASLDEALAALFERRGSRFTSPQAVREKAITLLSDRVLGELRAPGPADDDTKRRLKALTALATAGGTPDDRAAMLSGIRDGRTASFPFVLKYLTPGVRPSMRFFASGPPITLAGFRPQLEAKFPEAVHARNCLTRYRDRAGVLTRFINPEGPITASLAQGFDRLPARVLTAGGVLLPRQVALAERRRDRFRMPDGVVCAVSLGVLLESLLRQVAPALGVPAGPNARPADILRRIQALPEPRLLRAETADALTTVFDQRSLSLRDAMSHGAFFADDEARVDAQLAGLSQALLWLVEDVEAHAVARQAYEIGRWDADRALPDRVRTTITEQFEPGLNLVDQLRDDDARHHVFQVLRRLTPDKRLMGEAGFLLWISGQHDAHSGVVDETQNYAAFVAGLVVLEELMRAVYEVGRIPTLRVRGEGEGRVRCWLSILHDDPGELLDPASLRRIFRDLCDSEGFMRSLDAVKHLRDVALHGAWAALTEPGQFYSHMVMKTIFTICSMVTIEPARR